MPRGGGYGMGWRRGMHGAGGPGSYGGAGGSNPVPVVQNPRPIPGSGGQQSDDFFTQTVNVGSLTAGQTAAFTFTVQADSAFEWIETTAQGNLRGNTDDQNVDNINIPVTVLITDSGSGRILNNVPIPVSGLAGTGKQPFILPVPRLFLPMSTVSLTFTSFSANTWDNIFFNLLGRKIFNLVNG